MKSLFRYLAYTVVLVIALNVLVLTLMRFADGPAAILAGGAFTTGQRYTGAEPDWSFVRDITEVEFQLLDPARSRTTWILEHQGRIFIPCGYMDTTWGRLWKRWPIEAEQDGRAILRVDGTLYDRQLVRVKEQQLVAGVISELARKYAPQATPAAVADNSLWLFELTPRS